MNGQLLTTVSTILGIVVLVFAAGYNWRRITVLEEAFGRHLDTGEKRLASVELTYARKDLVEMEMQSIRSRLDFISKQLADVLESQGHPGHG